MIVLYKRIEAYYFISFIIIVFFRIVCFDWERELNIMDHWRLHLFSYLSKNYESYIAISLIFHVPKPTSTKLLTPKTPYLNHQ
jgi:hypothetical protein